MRYTMVVNGSSVTLIVGRAGVALVVDSDYWGLFVNEDVAMAAACVVLNAPIFGASA